MGAVFDIRPRVVLSLTEKDLIVTIREKVPGSGQIEKVREFAIDRGNALGTFGALLDEWWEKNAEGVPR